MKGLKEELDELREIFRNITPETEEEYKKRFLSIQERYSSPEDNEAINEFMMSLYKVMDEKAEEVERLLTIQEQLRPFKEILPMSYIARTYFGKSSAWLQQRIYGYKVRGKVYTLSEKDIDTLNFALQDISKKIGSLSITAWWVVFWHQSP